MKHRCLYFGIALAALVSIAQGQVATQSAAAKQTLTPTRTADYSSGWTVQRDWNNRTSLITDPPDGRIPAMTPEGQKRRQANAGGLNRPANEPQDRPLQERCITYGSPQLVAGYQSYYQIVQ